ncbi:hypothetical protein TNCV_2484431 [Trichonephila clavipes]|uniref:Uncharacterized protein n=1 Tax=Trichonephila clavipes TaxID=2585209 RepID=A0A8X7BB31_TRICX|nr:hypothetical protein TNCV_2484431 [Trichonephila clavipes]
MNIKFCVRLLKSATENFNILKYVDGCDTLLRTQAFEWHRRFGEGKESVEDDTRSGRPQTSRIAEGYCCEHNSRSCHPSGIMVSDADCCAIGHGGGMDACKCIVPLRHGSIDIQELLDFHYQELTMDELMEKHDIEELESLDPVQSEDRMTVGNLTERLRLIEKVLQILRNTYTNEESISSTKFY